MDIAENKMYLCMVAISKKIPKCAEFSHLCLANLILTLISRAADLVFKNQRLPLLELHYLKNSKLLHVFLQWNLVLLASILAKIKGIT
jgi:hypothetical protein